MKKLIENNKKITAAVLALILGAAAVFGIAAAVRATTSSTVMVVRASELNYGEYLDWQNSVAGMITTDAEQDVYLSDTEVVEEVLVAEGQSVHKGDVLMRYDTTSTKLSLEKEKINYEKIQDIGITCESFRPNPRSLTETSGLSGISGNMRRKNR